MRVKILVLILTLFIFGCSKKDNTLSQDEYDIYSVLIDSLLVGPNKYALASDSIPPIIVYHQTITGMWNNSLDVLPMVIYLNDSANTNLRQIDNNKRLMVVSKHKDVEVLMSNFKNAIQDTLEIENGRIKLSGVTILIKDVNNADMSLNYSGYIGLITFSRVGFNSARNEALVYFHHTHSEDQRTVYYLQKSNGRWGIVPL